MADSAKLKMFVEAKQLGIPNYRSMSEADLKKAIASAKGGSAKATPAKATVAKKATPAKRTPARKPVAKKSPAKAPAKKTPVRKPAASSAKSRPAAKSATAGKAKRATTGTAKRSTKADAPGRNLIDTSAISWNEDFDYPRAKEKQTILKAVKKFKGNTDKVYDALVEQAKVLFPKNKRTGERYTAEKSRTLLRWTISRIKYDYVLETGQHESSTNRVAYGTRQVPAKASKPVAKKAPAKTTARKAPAKAPARRGRPPAAKGRPATRKPVAKRTAARKR